MSSRLTRFMALFFVIVILASGLSASALTATVVMRISRTAQDSVIDVGEDLSIEVDIEGVVPASYGWHFNGEAIPGANQRVYNIENAAVEDAGVYSMEAYDSNGGVILIMDFSVRVIDPALPKAGDNTLSVGLVSAIMLAAFAAAMMVIIKKRRTA